MGLVHGESKGMMGLLTLLIHQQVASSPGGAADISRLVAFGAAVIVWCQEISDNRLAKVQGSEADCSQDYRGRRQDRSGRRYENTYRKRYCYALAIDPQEPCAAGDTGVEQETENGPNF